MELYFYMALVFVLSLAQAALVGAAVVAFLLWLEGGAYTDPY